MTCASWPARTVVLDITKTSTSGSRKRIILGHADWKHGEIKIYATFPREHLAREQEQLIKLTSSGRLPISAKNIRVIAIEEDMDRKQLINGYSMDADLTLIGFHEQNILKEDNLEVFTGYEQMGNILFVNTLTSKFIR